MRLALAVSTFSHKYCRCASGTSQMDLCLHYVVDRRLKSNLGSSPKEKKATTAHKKMSCRRDCRCRWIGINEAGGRSTNGAVWATFCCFPKRTGAMVEERRVKSKY